MNRHINRLGKGISIHDVGHHAGVSHTTVSRVIRGDIGVSTKTRARVITAIEALNYVPNPDARKLAKSQTVTLGIPILTNAPNIDGIVSGVVQQAVLQSCRILSRQCANPHRAAFMLRELAVAGAQGIILIAPLCDDPLTLGELAASGLSTVLVGSDGPVTGYPSITVDEYKAASEATSYLLSRGHRQIGFIRGAPEERSSSKIFLGYVAAMRQANIEINPNLIEPGASSYRGGLHAAERLLKAVPNLTAIFASNDEMAAATVVVAQKLGLGIPQDLSVVGFGDASIAAILSPSLTTVQFPFFEMGREAVKVLVAEISPHGCHSDPQADLQRILGHRIVPRQTS